MMPVSRPRLLDQKRASGKLPDDLLRFRRVVESQVRQMLFEREDQHWVAADGHHLIPILRCSSHEGAVGLLAWSLGTIAISRENSRPSAAGGHTDLSPAARVFDIARGKC